MFDETVLTLQGNMPNEDAGGRGYTATVVDGAAVAAVGFRVVRVWHCGPVAFVLVEAGRRDRLSEQRVAAVERHRTTKADLVHFLGTPTSQCGGEQSAEVLTWTTVDAARLPLIAVGFATGGRPRDFHVRLGDDGTVEACAAGVGTGGG